MVIAIILFTLFIFLLLFKKFQIFIRSLLITLPFNTPEKFLGSKLKLSNRKNFSTATYKSSLNPSFVTGFADGESCFTIIIIKDRNYKKGWRVKLEFIISLHEKDKPLLEEIKIYFRVGDIYKQGAKSIQFIVQSVKGLQVIINHFDKYPLITQKKSDFLLFKQAFNIIKGRKHLREEGAFLKIVAIKASINRGLLGELNAIFSYVIPEVRPLVEDSKVQDPNWLAGFISAEGCFDVSIIKSSKCKSGFQVQLRFRITQNIRDECLMKSLIDYFHCGYLSRPKDIVNFTLTNFKDITQKLIPLFLTPAGGINIHVIKNEDLKDFCRVAEMIQQNKHLTLEGLEEIRKIKSGMNRGRSL